MEVFNDAEMDRIVALPRRPAMTAEEVAEATSLLTAALRRPEGTMTLNPIQAESLAEIHTYKRLFGAISAGGGKTLLSALLGTLLKSRRTLLFVPAMLRKKTIDELRALAKHWQIPAVLDATDRSEPGQSCIRVQTYEALSRVNQATYIEEFDPEVIICDEAHALQKHNSGRSKRVFRFIRNKRRRGGVVHFIPMTATALNKSFRQIAYLMEAALEDGSPLPNEYSSLEQWCFAVDRGIKEGVRYEPGALLRLCTEEQRQEGISGVRRAIRDRMLATPGFIASRETACGLPLILQRRHIEPPAEVVSAMAKLRDEYVLPSGDSVEAGVTFWAHAREIANGFAYYFDPPPPAEWRNARAGWHAFVRDVMQHPGNNPCDTPLQVWQAVESGRFGEVPEWDAWRAIRHEYTPVSKPYWLSDYLVRDAEDWALSTGGIVWVQHAKAHTSEPDDDAIGGKFTRIPYFGGGDDRIRTYRGPCVASVQAHGTGKNLVQWDEALLMGFPSSGKTIEQLLARLHRNGQTSDTVRFWFYAHSRENLNAISTCMQDAEHVKDLTGMDQRILGAHLLDADGSAFTVEGYETTQEGPMWSETPESV